MTIDARFEGDIAIIDPGRRLTMETEAAFTETVCDLIETGYTRLLLDMARVVSMDAGGLGSIARASVAARTAGGELKLLNLGPRNRHLLTITGLLNVLRSYDSEAEGVISFTVNPQALWGDADGASCGVFAV